ncbi:MAG TPA: GH25 family lysozyme [Kofleriaceae bacterium]|nr:GH25 family lysozyme [Kofleriaceae bacterium]
MRSVWGLVIALAACNGVAATDGTDEEASVSVCAAGATTVHGVDTSSEVVDWQAFAAGGWDFGIVKATEGVTFVTSQFETNWKDLKAAGVVRGAYCFFHSSPDDPVTEADFFVDEIDKAGGVEPGDFLALDLEVLDNNTPEVVAADALAFLQRVKLDTGITPIIYTSPRVFDTLLGSPAGFDGYPLWDVTWNGGPPKCPNIPASWPNWAFWQYAGDSITAPGLPGSANDGDVFNGSRDQLVAFGKSLGPPPLVDEGTPVGLGDPNLGSPENGIVVAGGCSASGASGAGSPAIALLFGLALRRRKRP